MDDLTPLIARSEQERALAVERNRTDHRLFTGVEDCRVQNERPRPPPRPLRSTAVQYASGSTSPLLTVSLPLAADFATMESI